MVQCKHDQYFTKSWRLRINIIIVHMFLYEYIKFVIIISNAKTRKNKENNNCFLPCIIDFLFPHCILLYLSVTDQRITPEH